MGAQQDLDCNGTQDPTDVQLPAALSPAVKDLLLELDWMVGEEPTANTIARLKEAFAAAPDYAGANNGAPTIPGGIQLWVDTGTLVDPVAGGIGGG